MMHIFDTGSYMVNWSPNLQTAVSDLVPNTCPSISHDGNSSWSIVPYTGGGMWNTGIFHNGNPAQTYWNHRFRWGAGSGIQWGARQTLLFQVSCCGWYKVHQSSFGMNECIYLICSLVWSEKLSPSFFCKGEEMMELLHFIIKLVLFLCKR